MPPCDDKKQTVDVALKAAQAMIKVGIETIGKADNNDDHDWCNMTLSIAVGILLVSFQRIDEAIPRIAAQTYLNNLKEERMH